MYYSVLFARLFLGGIFTFFGFNYFVRIIEPGQLPPDAMAFLDALTATDFMHPLRSGVELASGLLILTGIGTPLGLTLLAPVMVHIMLYHYYLDPSNLGFTCFLLAVHLFLAYAYGSAFRGMLNPTAKPRWVKRRRLRR